MEIRIANLPSVHNAWEPHPHFSLSTFTALNSIFWHYSYGVSSFKLVDHLKNFLVCYVCSSCILCSCMPIKATNYILVCQTAQLNMTLHVFLQMRSHLFWHHHFCFVSLIVILWEQKHVFVKILHFSSSILSFSSRPPQTSSSVHVNSFSFAFVTWGICPSLDILHIHFCLLLSLIKGASRFCIHSSNNFTMSIWLKGNMRCFLSVVILFFLSVMTFPSILRGMHLLLSRLGWPPTPDWFLTIYNQFSFTLHMPFLCSFSPSEVEREEFHGKFVSISGHLIFMFEFRIIFVGIDFIILLDIAFGLFLSCTQLSSSCIGHSRKTPVKSAASLGWNSTSFL